MKNRKKLLIILMVILAMMSLATYTGVTTSLFVDEEQSTDDALGFRWGLTTLDDGFEGTPWNANWDENGTTSWGQSDALAHTGSYSAMSDKDTDGYLTSDDLDASSSANITVHFWFYPNILDLGDVVVESYNGSAYNTLYDLTNYPTYSEGSWCEFSELITDSQYFIAGFRIRFNSSALNDKDEIIYIDDVLVITDSIPPSAPTGLGATLGDTQVSLDWDDNSESDINGYNEIGRASCRERV